MRVGNEDEEGGEWLIIVKQEGSGGDRNVLHLD